MLWDDSRIVEATHLLGTCLCLFLLVASRVGVSPSSFLITQKAPHRRFARLRAQLDPPVSTRPNLDRQTRTELAGSLRRSLVGAGAFRPLKLFWSGAPWSAALAGWAVPGGS
jgi:hypothetical protein